MPSGTEPPLARRSWSSASRKAPACRPAGSRAPSHNGPDGDWPHRPHPRRRPAIGGRSCHKPFRPPAPVRRLPPARRPWLLRRQAPYCPVKRSPKPSGGRCHRSPESPTAEICCYPCCIPPLTCPPLFLKHSTAGPHLTDEAVSLRPSQAEKRPLFPFFPCPSAGQGLAKPPRSALQTAI